MVARLPPDAHSALGSSIHLLAMRHATQDEVSYIFDSVVTLLVRTMNLSREVHGVVTYYHDLRTSRPSRVTIRLCRMESSRNTGSEALAAHIKTRMGYRFGAPRHRVDAAQQKEVETGDEHYPHDDIDREAIYCLGLRGTSPA